METSRKIKYSGIDRLILGIAYALLGLFVLSIVIPLIYVVLASFMDPTVLNNQGLSFRIKDWTLDAYRRVLENEMIWRGFFNSFFYSLAFTAISVFITLLAAYPMSKKEFVGRNFFNVIFLITMFFGGGMIPTFILINRLHYGEYCMGYFNTRSIQCMEYDSCKNLLPVNTKGTQRGVIY